MSNKEYEKQEYSEMRLSEAGTSDPSSVEIGRGVESKLPAAEVSEFHQDFLGSTVSRLPQYAAMPLLGLLPQVADVSALVSFRKEFESRYLELSQSSLGNTEEQSRELLAEESLLAQVLGWIVLSDSEG